MLRLILALAYLSPIVLISPCLAADGVRKDSRGLPIERFSKKLKTQGSVTQFTPVLVKLMDFPEGATKKTIEAPASQAEDGLSRLANIVFSKADRDMQEEVGLYWTTRRGADRKSESYLYRSSLDGGLERAVRVDGQLDDSGNDIRGASKATNLDVRTDDVRQRFQRQVLDFWLKGKGRKKGGAKAAPAKRPANPR